MPVVLRRSGVLAAILLLVLATPFRSCVLGGDALAVVYTLPYRVATAQANESLEVVTLRLLNKERIAARVAPLKEQPTLRAVARNHGVEMFTFGYLSHLSRDGRLPWQRVADAGFRAQYTGENLAYASDVQTAHGLLMRSPAHRRNILLPGYHRIGIGVVDGGTYGVIVVEEFSD